MTVTEETHDADGDEPGLDVEALREQAHKEMEIARLLGPSDENEERWLHYLTTLVAETDAYLEAVKG